jgi:hypothetical protein
VLTGIFLLGQAHSGVSAILAGMDIGERNRLRAEAHLPLLDIAAEVARLQKIETKAEFEREWERRKPEFAKWIAGGLGWFGKMGRWSNARKQVLRQLREAQGSDQ